MREIIIRLIIVFVILGAILTIAAGLIWLERRLLALWQDRFGPNRVGPFGLLQVVADVIKLFTKEDWVPPFADKPVFVIAPVIIMVTTLVSFAIVVFAPGITVIDLGVGVLFFLAMSSLGVYSVVLAGWSSNNKYAMLGGLRAAAQMLSYEVFMGLSLMGVVMLAGSFNIAAIVEAQKGLWFCLPQFPGLFIFFIAGIAGGAPPAFRPSRGGKRACRGLPQRVFGNEICDVFRGGISVNYAHIGACYNVFFRRVAWAVAAACCLVCN